MKFLRKIFKYKNILLRQFFSKSKIKKFYNHSYTVYFDKKKNNLLSKLSNLHKTNKGYILDQTDPNALNIKSCHKLS